MPTHFTKGVVPLALAGLVALGVSSAAASDAKENWTKHCAKCHGEDGRGQTVMGRKAKLKDYTSAADQKKFTDEEALRITREGKKERGKTVMKGYSDILSDADIKALVDHVRKFKK